MYIRHLKAEQMSTHIPEWMKHKNRPHGLTEIALPFLYFGYQEPFSVFSKKNPFSQV